MEESIRKTIVDFGERLTKYQELSNRTCLFDRTDVTFMQMHFALLVSELERLENEKYKTSELNNG